MTQLSTGKGDRTGRLAAAGTTADKPRHPGGSLSTKSNPHAPQPMALPEQGVPVVPADADLWDEGRAAALAGNHERATAYFVREAENRSSQGNYGRAAIAFRTAAELARMQGLAEQHDLLLTRAAGAYVQAAERNGLTAEAIQQAWISAAKCFLQLQQLDRAVRCIEQARTRTRPASGPDESTKAPS